MKQRAFNPQNILKVEHRYKKRGRGPLSQEVENMKLGKPILFWHMILLQTKESKDKSKFARESATWFPSL